MRTWKSLKIVHRTAGMTLVEVMVSLGIFGLIAWGVTRLLGDGFQNAQSAHTSLDQSALGQYFLEFVDCPATMNANDTYCNNNDYIDLRNSANKIILNRPSDTVYGYPTRARCDKGEINLEVKLSKDQGYVPLFKNVPFYCAPAIKKCSIGTVTLLDGAAPWVNTCPSNSAVYAADDGKELRAACCALPTTDVFPAGATDIVRATTCIGNEIMVGTGGFTGPSTYRVLCRSIDTSKYKLGPSVASCYYGSGASGSAGSGPCGAPNMMINALAGTYGIDGCTAQVGSVIVARTGKNCGNVAARQLMKLDNTVVSFPY